MVVPAAPAPFKTGPFNLSSNVVLTVEGTAFTNRLGLLEPWRGLRDAELVARSGIDGCKFVHATGFIGGNATYAGALAMALKTIEGGSTSVELK